jgi:hypothetical protein
MILLFCLQGAFNGNNTIDEIIFGVEIGVLIALFSHFIVRTWLDRHLTSVMEGMYINRHRILVYGSSICFLSIFILITALYLAAMNEFKPS